ncbi:MAG: hypothetical protein ACFFCX_13180 [Candidatus Sifarchaeia archaeon]
MSEAPPKEKNDVKQLKAVVEDLRCAVIVMIIVVSLLAGYIALQLLEQSFITYLSDPRLVFVGLVAFLIVFALWLATSKGE